jgi:DNA polymerase-3 subunit beta
VKFFCQRETLLTSIQIVQKAVASKSTIPILGGIYLHAENGILELQANDYDTAIKCSLPVQVLNNGTTVLSSKYFSEIIRKMPGDTVEISSSDNTSTVSIKSENANYELVSMPYKEFPTIQLIQTGYIFEISEDILKNMIRKTTFACSQDDARPVFTGVLVEIENENINMVATNTHRLAFCKGKIDNHTMNSLKVIVPAKIMIELNKILSSESEEKIIIKWHQNKLAFQFRDIYMETQLIDGQFPNYQQVIPKNFKTELYIQTNTLAGIVERASLLTRDGDYNVVKMDIKDMKIIVTSNNPEVGAGHEEAEATTKGEQITIAFNARYILEVLKVIDNSEVEFYFTSPLTPSIIKPRGQEQFMYVITPVRTN